MKAKYICLLFISILVGLLAAANADGVVIQKVPVIEGDWAWLEEKSQQAFINYQDGLEKLIVAIDIEEHDSDAMWIMPVPGKPGDVGIDITSDLPAFSGNDVMSKAKLVLHKGIKTSCIIGVVGQLWPIIPGAIILPSFMRLPAIQPGPGHLQMSGKNFRAQCIFTFAPMARPLKA
jgi:hypothetical protein